MRLPRIYHSIPLCAGGRAELSDSAANHVARVLRLQVGAPLIIFNGEGGEFAATIEILNKNSVTVRLGEFNNCERESPLTVWLAQGISRGERMDFTIQKAVEMGVSRIIPLFTEHCGVQLDEERLKKRLRHWQGVATSACEQCGRNRIPHIDPPAKLSNWLMEPGNGLRLVLDPNAEHSLPDIPPPAQCISLLIGPEGGLSEQELELAKQAGHVGLRLGPRILRTETAAVAALAAAQALWGDL